jgi:P-type E1-E2 ATPase
MSGEGRAVVLAVGPRTRREQELTDQKLEMGNQVTPMQEKLEDFADLLSKYATYAAFTVLFILSVYELLQIMFGSSDFISSQTLFTLIDNIQITIALLIVCVPEGLPLAVSMSMAFSIDRLIEDNLLIKELNSLETSGSVLDILTGKTSTLTNG